MSKKDINAKLRNFLEVTQGTQNGTLDYGSD